MCVCVFNSVALVACAHEFILSETVFDRVREAKDGHLDSHTVHTLSINSKALYETKHQTPFTWHITEPYDVIAAYIHIKIFISFNN